MKTRNSSSMVRIGWTTESRPLCSAKACNRNAQIMKPKPSSHTPSTDGVRHQAEAHGGLLRGVFDAHALEHAGQRVRQGRCYGKDIDHRLAANLVVNVTDHAGGSQLAPRFCLARAAAASRRNRVQTATAHRIGPLLGAFPHEFSESCPKRMWQLGYVYEHLPTTTVGFADEGRRDRPSPGRPTSKGSAMGLKGIRTGSPMRLGRTLALGAITLTCHVLDADRHRGQRRRQFHPHGGNQDQRRHGALGGTSGHRPRPTSSRS